MLTSLEQKLISLIEPPVHALGFDVVRVLYTSGQRARLQVMIERQDRGEISVDDCARISRTLSPILEVEDPIMEAYNLEITSPGIDRPLVHWRDYERFLGNEIKIELHLPQEGQKRFYGTLCAVDDNLKNVHLMTEQGTQIFAFADIKRAKLILTEALIQEALKKRDTDTKTDDE